MTACRVFHRDLRMENLLLDGSHFQPRIKITGFGYSKSAVLDSQPKVLLKTSSFFSRRWTLILGWKTSLMCSCKTAPRRQPWHEEISPTHQLTLWVCTCNMNLDGKTGSSIAGESAMGFGETKGMLETQCMVNWAQL